MAIAWNDLEGFVDTVMLFALVIQFGMMTEVATRINGFNGKIALIKLAASRILNLTVESKLVLDESLAAASECKVLRDAEMHAVPYDSQNSIGLGTQRKGKTFEVLWSVAALNALYDRLVFVKEEMREFLIIFGEIRTPPTGSTRAYADLLRRQLVPAVQECVVRAWAHQKKRRSLPPFPKWPDLPPPWGTNPTPQEQNPLRIPRDSSPSPHHTRWLPKLQTPLIVVVFYAQHCSHVYNHLHLRYA